MHAHTAGNILCHDAQEYSTPACCPPAANAITNVACLQNQLNVIRNQNIPGLQAFITATSKPFLLAIGCASACMCKHKGALSASHEGGELHVHQPQINYILHVQGAQAQRCPRAEHLSLRSAAQVLYYILYHRNIL